jgi:hypothetical protein
MNDIAPGSFSLEENALSEDAPAPAPAAEAAPPAPEPTAAPPPNPEDAEPEGTIVNPGGEKLVPLSALVAQRQAAKLAKEEAAQLREQTLEIDQIRGAWKAVEPIMQQVRNGTYQPPRQAEKPAGPLSEQDAVEYAKDLDLYKTDGTPDIARAQRLAARQEALAEKQAARYIQPLQQQSAKQQSAANLQVVSTWKDQSGATVDPAILKELWQTMPEEMTAQPNIAAVMYRVAIGETVLRGKHKTPTQPPPPVVETASLGGGGGARPELSTFERNFIQTTDMKPKEYEEISGRFKPGERNSLE